MTRKSALAAVVLALLAWAPLNASVVDVGPVGCGGEVAIFQLSNLNFDHAMLYNLVNEAIANNGAITNFNGGPGAGVLSVTIKNVGNAAGYCYIVPIIKQGGSGIYNCTNTAEVTQMTVATGPLLQTINPIPCGQTRQENISDFVAVTNNGYSGAFCTQLQNLVNINGGGNNNNNNGNDNGSGGASNILSQETNIVHVLNQLQFNICVLDTNSQGYPLSGQDVESCVEQPLSIFSKSPSSITASGLLVFPNNATVYTPSPMFLWTPTLYNGASIGLQYELVLSLSANGNPWYSVQVPNGQTFYKYQSTDRVLQPGQKYWWYVISSNAAGQTVGGVDGRGWNAPPDSFTYAPTGATGIGAVTLPQLSALIQQNASPAVLQALLGMQLVGVSPITELGDPDAAALVAKPSEIKNISVQKF